MADIDETKELFPTVEEIEGLELAELDKEEAAIEREEDQDEEEEVSGLGELGAAWKRIKSRFRSRKRSRRNGRRMLRRASRSRAVKRAYSAAKTSVAVKTGLTQDLTSKGEFELRRSQLPADIQKALKEGRAQTVDGAIYTIKSIKDKSDMDLMEASDDKRAGKTNINRAQLDNGKYFLLTGIVLEYAHGIIADAKPEDLEYGQFALPPEILNGTFDMKLGTKVIVPEISTAVFDDTNSTKRKYFYRLANPKWIRPSMDITPHLSMSKAIQEIADKVQNPSVKITLLGTMVEKA